MPAESDAHPGMPVMMEYEKASLSEPKLSDALSGMDIAMLTTRAANGSLVSRPLQMLEAASDALWFFTAASSGKAGELARDSVVNLAFADPQRKTYVSVSGRAEVLVDREKARELWNIAQSLFFPGGAADPELVLLKVIPDSAHCWDGRESILGTVIKFGKAMIAGEAQDLGRHASIDID